jgi:NAD-dependent SIR2 family protein deacetylase
MEAAAALRGFLAGRRVIVLGGAGLSTESGIPDYRGAGRPARTPIMHRDFVRSAAVRRRYWARAYVGWSHIRTAKPNPAHSALAALEARGDVVGVITQNVDELHQAAGSTRVVELHGSLWRVRCLQCGACERRDDLQERMSSDNSGWQGAGEARPDGDADVCNFDDFMLPTCLGCGGDLKPDVVMFGDNVARPVLDAAFALFDEADALLVAGSSLAVWSGFRFVRRAADRAMPIAIANLGPTRGDPFASLRIEARLGELLPSCCA